MAETFFVAEGDLWVPTVNTRGPWSNAHQHGGPPAALLGRAVERVPSDVPLAVTRLTFDLLRPVPIKPLRVAVEVARTTKRIQLVRAALFDGATELVTVQALRIRTEAVVAGNVPADETTDPDRLPETPFPFFLADVGYHTAMDLRIERGGFGAGFARAWMRSRVPLVPGEALSPLQRALLCADSGNGVSAALDKSRYTFVNPDLTVSLAREPVGDWVCLDAVTRLGADGRGVAVSDLRDVRGAFGTGTQSLLVDRLT